MFCEDGLRCPIRGFSFQIDTGEHPPSCLKITRYVPHDYMVVRKMAERMDENGVVEEDYGPWGALVVLATKPHQ